MATRATPNPPPPAALSASAKPRVATGFIPPDRRLASNPPPTLPRAARLPPQGTTNGFPLKIEVLVKEEREADFHAEFLVNTLAKIDWPAFTTAAESIGVDGLPSAPPEDPSADEPFLRAFHHALMEVHVKEGYLICPDSGRRFPITKGIPNMLLNEDEV